MTESSATCGCSRLVSRRRFRCCRDGREFAARLCSHERCLTSLALPRPLPLLPFPPRRYAHLLIDLALQLSAPGPSELDRVDEARILSLSAEEGGQGRKEGGRALASDGWQGRDIGLSSLEVDVRCVLGLRGYEETTLRAIEDEFAVFMFFEQEADGICCEPEADRDPTDTPHCTSREAAAAGGRRAGAQGPSDASRDAAAPAGGCGGTQRLFVLGDQVRACVYV
jgi:hypothetical protein